MGKDLQLPVTRVKLIMKSSPDVENIGQDALHLVTRATELFIQHLSQNAFEKNSSNTLDYKQLAEIVQTSENMTFLREIMPRKITVREYRKLMERNNENEEEMEED
ncbi:chromatin accessibility complex protein 1 [Macrosteles quadrilineatus]|uniref:chromatin accessibility complex protein 1 n=1 Tax=Macrosteles quadrilineatus TaxID=74068 RepID=UPI0023E120BC|nr:chromatin accessibility complex protein 1 [Macrosteles quadrilineatus]